LVDVHLDQLDLAVCGTDRFLDDRRELTAGAAPWRPEVDQHRLALRFLDDVLHEGLGGGLLDQIGRRLRRRSAALLYYRHGIPRLMYRNLACSSTFQPKLALGSPICNCWNPVRPKFGLI